MTTEDEAIKLALVNCIVHLLEHLREGGVHDDLVAAQNSILESHTHDYLNSLELVLLPIPRDGKRPLTFPD